jgi:hypothetical protein
LSLGHNVLLATVGYSHHSAASVGCPKSAIAFGKNTFGPLQVMADVPEASFVDSEIQNWIWARQAGRSAHVSKARLRDALYAIRVACAKRKSISTRK